MDRPKVDIDDVLADIATVLMLIEDRLEELEQRQEQHINSCPICRAAIARHDEPRN